MKDKQTAIHYDINLVQNVCQYTSAVVFCFLWYKLALYVLFNPCKVLKKQLLDALKQNYSTLVTVQLQQVQKLKVTLKMVVFLRSKTSDVYSKLTAFIQQKTAIYN